MPLFFFFNFLPCFDVLCLNDMWNKTVITVCVYFSWHLYVILTSASVQLCHYYKSNTIKIETHDIHSIYFVVLFFVLFYIMDLITPCVLVRPCCHAGPPAYCLEMICPFTSSRCLAIYWALSWEMLWTTVFTCLGLLWVICCCCYCWLLYGVIFLESDVITLM